MAKRKSTGGSSKSRVRERREARDAQRRRQRNLMFAGGLAVIAVVAVIVIFVTMQPQEAPIPEETFARYDGIPQTTNEDGFPVLGDPDAPVRVVEYSSFSCPSCRTWHDSNFDQVIEEVRAGVINFTYMPLQTGSIPNAEGAAKAALCAGEQGQFYEFHDALFDWQGSYGNRAFTQQRIDTGVENFSLNESAFSDCRGSSRVDNLLDLADDIAISFGIDTTPSFTVQGNVVENNAVFEAIDAALATTGIEPVPLDQQDIEATPEVTEEPEATEEVEETEEPEMTEEATEEATTEESADADTTPEGTEEADDS